MYNGKDVRITNSHIDVKAKVKLATDSLDEPIRIKSVGFRRWILAGCAIGIMLELSNISIKLGDANALKEEEIKIKKEQVELARRQFMLDSIAMEQNRKIR